MRLTHDSLAALSREKYELFHEGILEGNAGQVEKTLTTYQKGAVNLTAQHCFWAMKEAILTYQEEIGHLILNYAEKVYKEEVINNQIEYWRILVLAVGQNYVWIVKRLIEKKVTVDDSLLWIAFQEGHAEIVELLIAAGYSPQIVLSRDHRFFRNKYLEESHKKVWKLMVPHWKAKDVLQSPMIISYVCKKKRQDIHVLKLIEDLGMDFLPHVSANPSAAHKCMELALKDQDLRTVQFLLDRGFDVNTCFESKPLLHYLLNRYSRDSIIIHTMVLDAIKRGANLLLRDSDNESLADFCVSLFLRKIMEKERQFEFLRILKLLVRMGFRIPEKEIDSISVEYKDVADWMLDLFSENSSMPSLQSLCRREIRVAKGIKIAGFMDQLKYPQALKDFVLLKDINFEEFKFSYSGYEPYDPDRPMW